MSEDKFISLDELEQRIEDAIDEAFDQWLKETLAEGEGEK
jgi:hypothetical protein